MKTFKIAFNHSETKRRTAVRLSQGMLMLYASIKGVDPHDAFDKLDEDAFRQKIGLRDFLESNHERYNRLKPDSTFVSYLELLVSLEASDMISHYNMQNR